MQCRLRRLERRQSESGQGQQREVGRKWLTTTTTQEVCAKGSESRAVQRTHGRIIEGQQQPVLESGAEFVVGLNWRGEGEKVFVVIFVIIDCRFEEEER